MLTIILVPLALIALAAIKVRASIGLLTRAAGLR
jgi:hypothetical protein